MGLKLNAWQRVVLIAAAILIGLLGLLQIREAGPDGIEWIWPLLISAGLLLVAMGGPNPSTKRQVDGMPPTNLSLQDKFDPSVEWARTHSLAEKLYDAVGRRKIETTRGTAMRLMSKMGDLFARQEAICCAYSVAFYRPRRRPAGPPTSPDFDRYRDVVKGELIKLMSLSDQFAEQLEEPIEQGMSQADRVELLLKKADVRRTEAESENNLVKLVAPMVKVRTDFSEVTAETVRQQMMEMAKIVQQHIIQTAAIPSIIKNQQLHDIATAIQRIE